MLSVARDLFITLGDTSCVERCDRELRAGGVHASRTERGPHELTAQETAVADLVARGLPNKEIAAELHVSPKTVQYQPHAHLHQAGEAAAAGAQFLPRRVSAALTEVEDVRTRAGLPSVRRSEMVGDEHCGGPRRPRWPCPSPWRAGPKEE